MNKSDKKHNRFVVAFVALFLLLLVWVWVVFFMVKALPNIQQAKNIVVAQKAEATDLSLLGGVYTVNSEESSVVWTGKAVGKSHEGTIDLVSGVVSLVEGQVNAAFVIDMPSIKTTDLKGKGAEGLDNHLKNEDFFDVEAFPTAEFATTSVVIDRNVASVTGNLVIKGKTNPVSFPMTFSEKEGIVTAKGLVSFDRTLFDVQYNSGKFFEDLGDSLIEDVINLEVELVLTK